jgi:hypothetical protein
MKNAFNGKEILLKNRAGELALEIYNTIFSSNTIKKMEDLPEGWLPKRNSFSVMVDGKVCYFEFNNGLEKPFPYERVSDRYGCPVIHNFSKDKKAGELLCRKIIGLQREKEALKTLKQKTRSDVEVTLKSFNTSGKLIEAWSEIKPIVEKICGDEPVTVLAPQLKSLNKMLGL